MKPGAAIAIFLTIAGLCAVIFSFVKNASPYVTVAQAKAMNGDNLHLFGSIDKSTIQVSGPSRTVTFVLIDEDGDKTPVIYHGAPPSNLSEATEVVAIGGMNGDHFKSNKLLLKCPSKYESEADDKK